MQRRAFKAGETIFKTGDTSDLAYVIIVVAARLAR
jgi:CRP-like cAMP-binding protein